MTKINYKCEICKRKLNRLMLQLHTCRCKGLFCSEHKHDHKCSHDFRPTEAELVKVIAIKIDKI